VFVPTRRKKTLYGQGRQGLGSVLHAVASQRRSERLAGHRGQAHGQRLSRLPPQYAGAEVVGYSQGQAAMAVARPWGGRTRPWPGETCWARGAAVATVGGEEEQRRRYIRSQEPLETAGEDEDGACEATVRPVALAALGAAHNRQAPRSAGAS
jgi:putative transposase